MLTDNFLRNRTASLSGFEREALEAAITRTRLIPAGQVLMRHGDVVECSTLLVQGLISRYVDAPDGRRHLVAVHVPGDFVDLHAYALKKLDHDVGALTEVTVAVVTHAALAQMQADHPRWTQHFWFSTLLDAAMHRQWTYRLASLNALQRVAHFLCEMNARLTAIAQSDGMGFSLPMTQGDIGEVCGLTNVHVNRVLRQLREMGLCQMRSAQVDIQDLRGLAAAGTFQAEYLYLDGPTLQQVSGQERSP